MSKTDKLKKLITVIVQKELDEILQPFAAALTEELRGIKKSINESNQSERLIGNEIFETNQPQKSNIGMLSEMVEPFDEDEFSEDFNFDFSPKQKDPVAAVINKIETTDYSDILKRSYKYDVNKGM